MRRRSLVPIVALALIAAPEPVTTVVGVALLCLWIAWPHLTGRVYRAAPCSGVIVYRGSLP